MNYIWGFIIIFSYIFSFFYGTTEMVTESLFSGALKAIETVIALSGMMCFWTGLLEVSKASGITKLVARILSPLINILFPTLQKNSEVREAIVMNMTANILGLSNAATPLGLAAMEKLNEKNLTPGTATDDMCIFVVINTASITLIPTTLLTLRSAANSLNPFEILIPVWICSIFSVVCGIVSAKLFARRQK